MIKRQNKTVLNVVSDIEELLKGIDCRETNIEGRDFIVSRNLSRLWAPDRNYACICICGGRNSGRGLWSEYMKSLSEAMRRIEAKYQDVFIDRLENDTADDIFYLYIVIKMK